MKKYVYQCIPPYRIEVFDGVVDIQKGDVITKLYEEGKYSHCLTDNSVSVSILSEHIEKFFKRVFTKKEEECYQQLRCKAAVAAMQGIMSNLELISRVSLNSKTSNISAQQELAELSVTYADALVKALQETQP